MSCCCHSVAVMIAATVAPAGVRSIARMLACLVPGRVEVFGDECGDRERSLDLLVVRALRVEAFWHTLCRLRCAGISGPGHGNTNTAERPYSAPAVLCI